MGIGNTTLSAAMIAAFSGIDPKELTDRTPRIPSNIRKPISQVSINSLKINRTI
ncbi:MAG: nicotinate-nucleotide--dimethylbenzimidazole phosphoribosyltransferase [Desulfobacterium sp.]